MVRETKRGVDSCGRKRKSECDKEGKVWWWIELRFGRWGVVEEKERSSHCTSGGEADRNGNKDGG